MKFIPDPTNPTNITDLSRLGRLVVHVLPEPGDRLGERHPEGVTVYMFVHQADKRTAWIINQGTQPTGCQVPDVQQVHFVGGVESCDRAETMASDVLMQWLNQVEPMPSHPTT